MKYGVNAKIGNITVFSREGAIEAFKKFVEVCYNELTMESSCVLSACVADMHELGFDWDEIEAIELGVIA